MTRLFTSAEAAAITGLPTKAVHNAIDKRVVEPAGHGDAPLGRRLMSVEDLVRLSIWRGTGETLSAEQRDALFAAMMASPRVRTLNASSLLIVDVAEARRQVARGIRHLEAAEAIIVSDKAVLGGEPVVKGTRIPVHALAAMRTAGASTDELIAGYPELSRQSLGLAEIWSRAHPRRGRPKPLSALGLKIKGTKLVALKQDPLARGQEPLVPAAE